MGRLGLFAAAPAHGKTIVIRFNPNAWIDVTWFRVQAGRTGCGPCMQNPTMTRQSLLVRLDPRYP